MQLGVVAREMWGWSPALALTLTGFFLVIDLTFFGANVVKITHGGWFPLAVGVASFLLMTTWKKGAPHPCVADVVACHAD